jgi:hypothetical protein
MFSYCFTEKDIQSVFWKKNSLLIIPSIFMGLALMLFQYWDKLSFFQLFLVISLVCLFILPTSLFVGYQLLKKRLVGVKITINDDDITYTANNGKETKISLDDSPNIKRGVFGVSIVKGGDPALILSLWTLRVATINSTGSLG